MGGTIDVETQAGKGSTFEVRLPLAAAEPAAVLKQVNVSSRRAATVLIVDDDVRVRAVAFTALSRVGHRVFEAPTVHRRARLGACAGQQRGPIGYWTW